MVSARCGSGTLTVPFWSNLVQSWSNLDGEGFDDRLERRVLPEVDGDAVVDGLAVDGDRRFSDTGQHPVAWVGFRTRNVEGTVAALVSTEATDLVGGDVQVR